MRSNKQSSATENAVFFIILMTEGTQKCLPVTSSSFKSIFESSIPANIFTNSLASKLNTEATYSLNR